MPSVRTIDAWAFQSCNKLTELDLPSDLDMVGEFAFDHCLSLRRITMPLKYDMMDANVFRNCPNLTTLNLVGGIHTTVASLHMESWRNGMREEINRINRSLSSTNAWRKTAEIQQWITSVIGRIEHYKTEHKALLKEAASLLELARWKAHLDENEGAQFSREFEPRGGNGRGQGKRFASRTYCLFSH
jgi:hypothetical protein